MTSIQVADQTFIAAPPTTATAVIADRGNWRRWWPDLQLSVVEDRAEQGVRWSVTGPLTGTSELWLEPVLDGFVMHYFLHAEPTGELPAEPRALMDTVAKLNHRRRVAGRAMAFEVKDRLERERHVGGPAVSPAGEVGAGPVGDGHRAEGEAGPVGDGHGAEGGAGPVGDGHGAEGGAGPMGRAGK